ncbi:MAG: redoxin domain-containing protein [Gemmataceae bacterium]
MMQPRSWVPVLGFLALVGLFLSLPEIPDLLGVFGCKTCSARGPYLPLIGSGYFAMLIAVALLFPSFPRRKVARAGLTWAVTLATALTYVQLPGWCIFCLVAHACNISMWTIWMIDPAANHEPGWSRESRCLALFAPLSVVALFSSMNLTFMAYNFRMRDVAPTSLQVGDAVPTFQVETNACRAFTSKDVVGSLGAVVNFVSPDCPYCEEQLAIVNATANELIGSNCRVVNISSALPQSLLERAPAAEWVEDDGGKLHSLFQVRGYPTLFVLSTDGTIAEVIAGVPEHLQEKLLTSLGRSP